MRWLGQGTCPLPPCLYAASTRDGTKGSDLKAGPATLPPGSQPRTLAGRGVIAFIRAAIFQLIWDGWLNGLPIHTVVAAPNSSWVRFPPRSPAHTPIVYICKPSQGTPLCKSNVDNRSSVQLVARGIGGLWGLLWTGTTVRAVVPIRF